MNNELRRLHVERMNRLNGIVPATAAATAATAAAPVTAIDAFECPVCYSDGKECGVVEPACKHKICLACYSNMLMRETNRTKCPCCRKFYLNSTVAAAEQQQQEDDYSDMPPLMSATEAAYFLGLYNNLHLIPAAVHNIQTSRSSQILDFITNMDALTNNNINVIHYEDPLNSNIGFINPVIYAPVIPNQQTMDNGT